jgi:hypothetical protein
MNAMNLKVNIWPCLPDHTSAVDGGRSGCQRPARHVRRPRVALLRRHRGQQPHLAQSLSEQELLNKTLVGDRSVLSEDLTKHESYSSVPGVDPGFGAAYDQDTNNQEERIRHFGHTIDKYQAANTAEVRPHDA